MLRFAFVRWRILVEKSSSTRLNFDTLVPRKDVFCQGIVSLRFRFFLSKLEEPICWTAKISLTRSNVTEWFFFCGRKALLLRESYASDWWKWTREEKLISVGLVCHSELDENCRKEKNWKWQMTELFPPLSMLNKYKQSNRWCQPYRCSQRCPLWEAFRNHSRFCFVFRSIGVESMDSTFATTSVSEFPLRVEKSTFREREHRQGYVLVELSEYCRSLSRYGKQHKEIQSTNGTGSRRDVRFRCCGKCRPSVSVNSRM